MLLVGGISYFTISLLQEIKITTSFVDMFASDFLDFFGDVYVL